MDTAQVPNLDDEHPHHVLVGGFWVLVLTLVAIIVAFCVREWAP